jgi:hypothetical protein
MPIGHWWLLFIVPHLLSALLSGGSLSGDFSLCRLEGNEVVPYCCAEDCL